MLNISPESKKYDRDLYARGFAFFPSGAYVAPAGFSIRKIGTWTLATHSRTRSTVAQCERGGDFVVLIGHAIDLDAEHDDQSSVASDLLRRLAKSERGLFEKLSNIAGRYALLYSYGGRVSVLGDACATRAVFYAVDRPLVGSHFQMLSQMAGLGASSQKSQRSRRKTRNSCYGYAVGATPDRNVSLLMANMVLRLPQMEFERFYPLGPVRSSTVEDAAEALGRHFGVQAKLLSTRFRCHISLTAGLDSRVSLAAFKDFRKEIETFSYSTQSAHEVDVKVASVIADQCRLEHAILNSKIEDKEDFHSFVGVVSQNNYHKHNLVAAYKYKSYFRSDSIHIRSNLFEIGRAFYRSQRARREGLNATEMAKLYYRDFSESHDQDLVDEFGRYMGSTRFEHALFNYDPYDIFYWEQRMSCWHAMVVLEADPSVETVLLFNARTCIESALGLPLEDRVAGAVFKRLIKMRWPELMGFPINPRQFNAQMRV